MTDLGMDFNVKKGASHENLKKYEKTAVEIAYGFAKEAYGEYGKLIKAIVLFGSASRHTQKRNSDIDILLILDDVSVVWTRELVETYKIIGEKLIAKVSPRIHVTTLKLTTFWEHIRAGDPIGINILRDGVALIDTGFFSPAQQMLLQGHIRPSAESVWNYYSRSKALMRDSRGHLIAALMDMYWACIDASHAALMRQGLVPPSPDHVADLVNEKLAKPGLIPKRHAETMNRFYKLYKAISHKEIGDVTGQQFEQYYAQAKDLCEAMQGLVDDAAKKGELLVSSKKAEKKK